MNGKKAKQIRREVYGEDFAPSFRQYFLNRETVQRVANKKRREYQLVKKQAKKAR